MKFKINKMDTIKNRIGSILSSKINGHPHKEELIQHAQDKVSNSTTWVRVNLQEYGYRQAGRHEGNPDALENHLEGIRNGQIVDENSDDERDRILREENAERITKLQEEILDHESSIRKIKTTNLKSLELEIDAKKREIDQINLDLVKILKYNRI